MINHTSIDRNSLTCSIPGGSAYAAGEMIQKLGGELLSFLFILELEFLHGRDKLPAPTHTLLSGQA